MEKTLQEKKTDHVLGRPFNVILFNDDHHSMDEVTVQIVKATGLAPGRAQAIMLAAHHSGRAVVITAHKERCEHVSAILEEIRLGTKIEPV